MRRLRSASTSGSTTPSLSFFVRGHDRPAAHADDVGVLRDRLLEIRHRLGAEDRQVGCHLAALRDAGVELLVPVAAARRIEEIGDHILRAGRAGEGAAAAMAEAPVRK
jgi:hypothetical protein